MEGKRNRGKKRAEARHSSSTSDSDSLSDVRSRIEQISLASGSDDPQGRFARIGASRNKEPTENGRLSRRQRNLDLYEDDYCKDSTEESLRFDGFAPEHQIIADIRSVNAGLNYSNRKLERIWGAGRAEPADDSPPPPPPDESKEWPALSEEARLERKKYRKNVAVTSLLEERERRTRRSDETETGPGNSREDENKDPNVCRFVRDPIDPDFFYRPTKVTDSDIDFTVPHVGKITVVGPRKYSIDNFKEEDIAFCKKKSWRRKDEKSSS